MTHVSQIATPNDTSTMTLALLGDRLSPRLRRLSTAYLVAGPLIKLAKSRYERAREQFVYTISINGTDSAYTDVQDWLLEQIPPARRRSLAARSTTESNQAPAVAHPSDGNLAPTVKEGINLRYDGSRSQTLHIEGHKVKVKIEHSQWRKGDDDGEAIPQWMMKQEKVIFTANTTAGRDAVVRFLEGVVARRQERPPRLFIADQWGGWNRHEGNITRPLESVILQDQLRENLVSDLQRFLTAEADYARLGFPYHRGFLFYGPPGTGKTSFAKALAAWFHLDVYYIPLPAVRDDGTLINLMQRVDPRSMLLLEDIDAVNAAKDRSHGGSDERAGVSISGLLNALDGVITPHGLVLVMTTNNRDALDPALIRLGRVDQHAEFELLDDDQLRRIVETFLGRAAADLPRISNKELSPADVLEAIKANLHDPDAGYRAVVDLVAGRIRLLETPAEVSD